MTFTQFQQAAEAARTYQTAEEYIDSNAYPEKELSPRIQIARAKVLWTYAAGKTPLEIVRAAGKTATAFCREMTISRRTFDGWQSGDRKPPDYVPPILAYILIADIA